MTVAKDQTPYLTPEEYFTWESTQPEKYEYIDGQVYAMGGGSINHGRISIRFASMLDSYLEDTGCITGNSDIKVNILGSNNYTYPDISVTCDDRDKANTQYITYPCLIIEVLSPSTEAYDRGGKFRMYRKNPALIDYLLVSSTSMEVDLYHKNDRGDWLIINYKPGEVIELQSINFNFPIDQVYRGLDLTKQCYF